MTREVAGMHVAAGESGDFRKRGSFIDWIKAAAKGWADDKAAKLSAALAYYVVLSLAPLMVIILKVTTLIVGEQAAQQQVKQQLDQLVGSAGAQAINDMLAHAARPSSGIVATIVSIVIVTFSASAVFGELQDSLDTIWEVKPRPGLDWWQTIRGRFFNMAMVFVVCFLLLVSLFFSVLLTTLGERIIGDAAWLAIPLDIVISTIVVMLLVGALFYLLPDVKISWRDVILGALITAILFKLGQYLLALYFKFGATTSPYGAAGSLVAVLLWAYYSGWILFFGAEFTQIYARAHGRGLEPTEKAIAINQPARSE